MSKNWKKDLTAQIHSHVVAYGLKELPYQDIPETTFEDILESQVSIPELETLSRYMN